MRFIFSTIIILLLSIVAKSQKPFITKDVYEKWPDIGNATVSDDGRFLIYSIRNKPVDNNTLVIQATDKSWKLDFINGIMPEPVFSANQKVVLQRSDTLTIVTLGASKRSIFNVEYFRITGQKKEWLVYKVKGEQNRIVALNLINDRQKSLTGIFDFATTENPQELLLQEEHSLNIESPKTLSLLNLSTFKTINIWKGKYADNYIFDSGGNIAFRSKNLIGGTQYISFWYYNKVTHTTVLLTENRKESFNGVLTLNNLSKFSLDGEFIICNLMLEEPKLQQIDDPIKVDVWSYKDKALQSKQLIDAKSSPNGLYFGAINVKSKNTISLNQRGDVSVLSKNGNWLLADYSDPDADRTEKAWNKLSQRDFFLIAVSNGFRKKIACNGYPNLSPNGDYVFYFDEGKMCYLAYERRTGLTYNITKNAQINWKSTISDHNGEQTVHSGTVIGWENTSSFYLSDNYDIWKIDLTGRVAPLNITAGYGKKNNVCFSFADDNKDNYIPLKGDILLSALNLNSKDNGFYKLSLGRNKIPSKINMGRYIYNYFDGTVFSDGRKVLKAKKSGLYIVFRQSADEFPNLFASNDLKTFKNLTDLSPQKSFNWIKSELITWQLQDGKYNQGILYKPENFDSTKRYPVIFDYYETRSNWTNKFLIPSFNGNEIDIPTYVSNEYLVFVPDIHYKTGQIGECALDVMLSAAKELSKFNYVDSAHLGLNGHSFGGYQTNYVVTHTTRFSAAVSGAGIVNFTSFYGSLVSSGRTWQAWHETGQGRFSSTLWDNEKAYISNSPIFSIPNVSTPILIMHNKNDGATPFSQAMEFFTALRRLGKKSWLLQYDDGGHGVHGNEAIADFNLRMFQFFNYYLKNKPAPKWMIDGIPAKLKGIDRGLELDSSGRKP